MTTYHEGWEGFFQYKYVTLKKVGADGQKAVSGEMKASPGKILEILYVFENGKVLTSYTGSEILHLWSPDLSEETDIEKINVPGEHGLNKDIEPRFICAYGNKFFFREYNGGFYSYDTDTGETQEVKIPGNTGNLVKVMGDLGITDGSSIFRISDGTVLATLKDGLLSDRTTAFGKDGFIWKTNSDGTLSWKLVRYPGADYQGAFSSTKQYSAVLGTDSSSNNNICLLDSERYAVADEYGFFQRTYEKGESEETTMLTADQINEAFVPVE